MKFVKKYTQIDKTCAYEGPIPMPAEFQQCLLTNLQLLVNVEQLDPLLILGLLQRGLKILLLKQWKITINNGMC